MQLSGLDFSEVGIPGIGRVRQDVRNVGMSETTTVEGQTLCVEASRNLSARKSHSCVQVENEADCPNKGRVIAGHQDDSFSLGLPRKSDVFRTGRQLACLVCMENLAPRAIDRLPLPEQFSVRGVTSFAVPIRMGTGRPRTAVLEVVNPRPERAIANVLQFLLGLVASDERK